MPVMTFEQWREKAKANAAAGKGGSWNEEQAKSNYDAYKWRQENPELRSANTGPGAYSGVEAGTHAGFNAQGKDSTGMRAAAKERGFSEDFGRFDEATLNSWEQYKSSSCPDGAPYKSIVSGLCVEKPIDGGGMAQREDGSWYTPDNSKGQPGGAAGNIPGAAAPAEPVTHGTQLSYTGDPMQDMLIHQFNTKANLGGQGMNVFGLGEDRAVGGEGQAADMQDVIGQTLSGGGLWWSGDESAFEGMKKKKSAAPAPKPPTPQAIAAPPPPATPPPAQTTPQPAAQPNIPQYKQENLGLGTGGMNDMMRKRYSGRNEGGGFYI